MSCAGESLEAFMACKVLTSGESKIEFVAFEPEKSDRQWGWLQKKGTFGKYVIFLKNLNGKRF